MCLQQQLPAWHTACHDRSFTLCITLPVTLHVTLHVTLQQLNMHGEVFCTPNKNLALTQHHSRPPRFAPPPWLRMCTIMCRYNRAAIFGIGEPLAPRSQWRHITGLFLKEFPEAYFHHVTEEYADLLHELGYYINSAGSETTLQVRFGLGVSTGGMVPTMQLVHCVEVVSRWFAAQNGLLHQQRWL